MANLYIDLPVPATDGVGASVAVNALGRRRTINVAGTFVATITIEVSNNGGVSFHPIAQFSQPGKKTIEVAAEFMRVRVAAAVGTVNANCDVSGNDNGTLAVALPATPSNGISAPVDVSAFGTFNTLVVTGSFTGTVILQCSADGVTFNDILVTANAAAISREFAAQFVRVKRSAVDIQIPGLPVVSLAAVNDATAGGGGATSWTSLTDTPGAIAANQFVRGNGAGTALVFYDLLNSVNLWTQRQDHSANIVPTADDVHELGDRGTPLRWEEVVSGLLIGWRGNPLPTIAAGQSGIIAGTATGPGTNQVIFGGGGFPPIALLGKVETTAAGATARLSHQAGGSIMGASAYAGAGLSEITSDAGAYGVLVGGYAFRPSGVGTARVAALGGSSGSAVWGYAANQGNDTSEITSSGYGNLVCGRTQGSGNHNIRATSSGCFAQGIAYGNTNTSILEAGGGYGAFAQGAVANGGLIAAGAQGARTQGFAQGLSGSIRATGAGSCSSGAANGSAGPAFIDVSSQGAHAFGYVVNAEPTAQAVVQANGPGAFACGGANVPAAAVGDNYIRANGFGAFAQGYANDGVSASIVEATGNGSFAQGNAVNGTITAALGGSFAQGVAGAGSTLSAAQAGAQASGIAYGGTILANAFGSFARGVALTNGILAAGIGSFAIGFDNTAIINAGVDNSVQIGPGTNTQVDSLQVGSAGLRMLGITGPPAVLQDGDIWVAGGAVYVRTGGVTKNLNNVP